MLEQQLQQLKDLPDRVGRMESQILQLRTDMKDGFSAIRSDLRPELHGVDAGLRTELHEVRDALRSELREVREDIRIGVAESQNLARGLHAEAMQEIAKFRRDVVGRLDQLLELRRPDAGGQ